MPSDVSLPLLLQAMAVAVGLGVVGGLVPAWRASRLTPAEAMRSEGGSVHVPRRIPSALLRNVLRQPTRSLLTVVGVGIAMMAIVLLGAMGDGVISVVSGLALGSGAHLVGSENGASIDLSTLDQDMVRRVAVMPGVAAAEGFLTGYTSLGDMPFFVIFGYQPRGRLLLGFDVVEGRSLSANRQVLLGRVAAQNLELDVGDTLRLFSSSFRVVGIYETGVPMQDGGAVISLRDAQKLFGQARKVSFVGVWVDEPQQADAVAAQIEERFPEIALSRASEFSEGVSDIQAMEASTWAIAAMALLVGGLGMTNTMVMSVFERTREIGVLRALGWRRARVLAMIVRESVALSLLGALAGTLVALLLGLALNNTPLVEGWFQLEYSVGLFAQAFGTAAVLGLVGGIYPAWRASNLQPVEALRYE